MASRQNLVIDVNINPNEQPSTTATDIRETPNPATNPINLRKIAAIGLVLNSGKQIATSTLGQLGAITGNARLQRRVNGVATLGKIGASFAINPIIGAVALATTIATETITAKISGRNENNSAIYYSKTRGRRTDKGRIV
jgi:hypothetical protein